MSSNIKIRSAGGRIITIGGKVGDICCCPGGNPEVVPYKFSMPICTAEKVRRGGTWTVSASCSYNETVQKYYIGGGIDGCGTTGSQYVNAYDRQLPASGEDIFSSNGCTGGNDAGGFGKEIGKATREAGVLFPGNPYEFTVENPILYGFAFALGIGSGGGEINFGFFLYASRIYFSYFDNGEGRPTFVNINILDQSYKLNGFAYGVGNPTGGAPFSDPCNIGWEKEEQFSTTITFNPTL